MFALKWRNQYTRSGRWFRTYNEKTGDAFWGPRSERQLFLNSKSAKWWRDRWPDMWGKHNVAIVRVK